MGVELSPDKEQDRSIKKRNMGVSGRGTVCAKALRQEGSLCSANRKDARELGEYKTMR